MTGSLPQGVLDALRLRDPRDSIPDFSFAGYDAGQCPLPSIERIARVVDPPDDTSDSTSHIQAALDEVGVAGGGVVLLSPGDYRLASDSLEIRFDNVVLRGDTTRTVLRCSGSPRNVINIGSATASGSAKPQRGHSRIVDYYVPLGATSVAVESTSPFQVGQEICLRKKVTAKWLAALGMDKLERDGKRQTWIKEGTSIDQCRVVSAIEGGCLHWEVPLTDSIDSEWTDGNSQVIFYDPPKRIRGCAVESLTFKQVPSASGHLVASQVLQPLAFGAAEDCWAKQLYSVGFCQFAVMLRSSRRITLTSFIVERNAPTSNGGKGALPLDITILGTQILVMHGRTLGTQNTPAYIVATGSHTHGPNVVTDYQATGCTRHTIEPHQRWATGMLVNNSAVGRIKMGNRGIMGSGQGWSMASGIIWACDSGDSKVDMPAVGPPNFHVPPTSSLPPSLFFAQLTARLGSEERARAIAGPVKPVQRVDWKAVPKARG